MADLDIKFLLQQKKAEKLKALEAARPTVPQAWDAKYIKTKKGHDGEYESDTNLDSDAELPANAVSPQEPDTESQSRSLTNQNPLRKDKLSQSSTILISIDSDKRRFFRPLADAITSSSGNQLGEIVLRLCVEYPDARAVVESLLAATSDESTIDNPRPLLRRSSNSKIEQSPQNITPIKKALENPLLPIVLNGEKDEQAPIIAKSARDDLKSPPAVLAVVEPSRKLPSLLQTSTSLDKSVVSEKRKREEPADAQSQKKAKPYHPKKNVPLSENKDAIQPLKLLSSNSPRTSEHSKPKSIHSLQPVSNSGDKNNVGGEPSDKHTCSVCYQNFGLNSHLERHMRCVHKTEGEPFGCSICTKKYARRDYLYRHLTTFHTTGLRCNACGLSYGDEDILNTHMRFEHDVQAVENKKIKESPKALNSAKKQTADIGSRCAGFVMCGCGCGHQKLPIISTMED